jgi:hypothetical protein
VAQYEALRAAVLAAPPEPAAGLGIVLRGGVGTWMRAYLTAPCQPGPPPARPDPRRLDQQQQELVRIWAQMVSPLDQEAADG